MSTESVNKLIIVKNCIDCSRRTMLEVMILDLPPETTVKKLMQESMVICESCQQARQSKHSRN